MATNKTKNFGLNQWVHSDQVLMEDFNEDNRKIEEAFSTFTCVRGTYYGTNNASLPKTIELGFHPSLVVILFHENRDDYGCVISRDRSHSYSGNVIAQITETGFTVGCPSTGSSYATPYTNMGGPYYYFAFR